MAGAVFVMTSRGTGLPVTGTVGVVGVVGVVGEVWKTTLTGADRVLGVAVAVFWVSAFGLMAMKLPSPAVLAESEVVPAPTEVSVTVAVPPAPIVTELAESAPGPPVTERLTTAPGLPVTVMVEVVAPAAGAAAVRPSEEGVAVAASASLTRACAAALVAASVVGIVLLICALTSSHTAICERAAWSALAGVGAPEGVRFRRIQVAARVAALGGGVSVTMSAGTAPSLLKRRVVSMQYPMRGTPSIVKLSVPATPADGMTAPDESRNVYPPPKMSGVGPAASPVQSWTPGAAVARAACSARMAARARTVAMRARARKRDSSDSTRHSAS